MILPTIAIVLIVVIMLSLNSINPKEHPEAEFFSKIVNKILMVLVLFMSLALIIQFLNNL